MAQRWTVRGFAAATVVLLLAASAASAEKGGGRDELRDRFDAEVAAGATGWQRIWYRAGATAKVKPFTDSGDLLLHADALEFLERKSGWRLPFANIRAIDVGRMKGDQDTDWIVLTVEDEALGPYVALRDGGAFGFGQRTRELHDALAKALREARAAQWNVPPGRVLFDALDHQIRLTQPEGWTTYAVETDFRDGINVAGTVVIDPGQGPGIRLVRKIDPARDRCDGLPPGDVEDLVGEVVSARAYLDGAVAREAVEVSEATVGGCRGVRVRGASADRIVDLFAVSHRGTRYVLAAVGAEDAMAVLVPELERMAASVEFPAIRWERARR